ncbi:MAG: RagB/SusD family nutrient uptake outer membrane protein [Bacteroides sp.]|nr:RagB/SusD family nutrient uptake outer membrane protein [Bacteroides sp.]
MKLFSKIAIYVGIGLFSLTPISCSDFLEREDDGKLQESEVFARFDKVNQLVTQLYSDMYTNSPGLNLLYSHNIGTICDELEYNKADSDAPYKILNGELSSQPGMIGSIGGGLFGWWWIWYQSIRKANKIIEGVEEYHTPDHPSKPGLLERRIGETYFFRAYYHYMILRWHGEMVYADRLFGLDEDPAEYAVRESVHTSVEKICHDLDEAAKRLPVMQEGEEFNRIDRGACLAVKAIVRWIAAQPLYNGGINGQSPLGDHDTRAGAAEYKVYDKTRWEKARDAAQAVIELANGGIKRYSLYQKYTEKDFVENSGNKVYKRLEEMFKDNDFYNKESILTLLTGKDARWIQDNIPYSYGSGQTRNQPTQEQVDQYEIIDQAGDCGWSIWDAKEKNLYDDANPYVNRDPRFYRDIVYLGAILMGKEYNTASGDDQLVNSTVRDTRNTRTGYALRKFIDNDWTTSSSAYAKHFPLIRLPEIMLIYAEALNETDGDVNIMKDMLNQIRNRSFMKNVPAEFDTDKEVRREYINRERRVELFFENNRFFTVRYKGIMTDPAELEKETRYLAMPEETRAQQWFETEGEYPQTQHYIHGMQPVLDDNGKISLNGRKYKMVRFEGKQLAPRRVTYRDYFFPINSNEIAKTPSLIQNPGW